MIIRILTLFTMFKPLLQSDIFKVQKVIRNTKISCKDFILNTPLPSPPKRHIPGVYGKTKKQQANKERFELMTFF